MCRVLNLFAGTSITFAAAASAFFGSGRAEAGTLDAAPPFPSRPIRFVVPFTPGGATDIVARLIGERLTGALGQQIIIDNRAGASGNIGAEIVARAAPDGHTWLMATTGVMAVNQSLLGKLPYDPERDFAPVMLTTVLPLILIVPSSSPAQSVKEIIATARSKPGHFSFASSGAGATTHVAGELFKSMARVDLLHVPYKGGGQLMNDLIGSQVSMSFFQIPGAIQHVKSGRLKALAISTSKRSSLMPELPTIAEAGVPGYEAIAWSGVVVAARTPRPIIERLNSELARALDLPDIKKRFVELGAEASIGTPTAFEDYIRSERKKWSALVRSAGIRAE